MSYLGKNGETTVDELTSISGALNISKFEVRRVLDRGVTHGFVIKDGRKYSRSDVYYTDAAAKKKRKQSKATRKYKKVKKTEKAEGKFKRKTQDTPGKAQLTSQELRVVRRKFAINFRGNKRRMDRGQMPIGKATVIRPIDRREIMNEYQPRRIDYTEDMSDDDE